jgi:hypothetical protein
MGWLGSLLKTSGDYFSTTPGIIVLVVILLTAIATTVLGYAIPAFGRFLRRLPKAIWRSLRVLKKWWRDRQYLRRFGPKYEVVSHGNLQVERVENTRQSGFTLSLPLTFTFENRDDAEQMLVECKDIQFRIDSQSVRGRRIPYYLNLTVVADDTTFWLPPNGKSGEKQYAAFWMRSIKPHLGNTAVCRMTRPGRILVGGVSRPIKVEPFNVEVDWSRIEKLISRKEGSQS